MKRKSLLVAMAAMSLAAIGAGSVSTLAWFTTSAELSGAAIQKTETVTITPNSVAASQLHTEIKFVIADQHEGTLYLSTWKDNGEGENPRYTLRTTTKDTAGSTDHYIDSEPTGVVFYKAYKVSAYAERKNDSTGTVAEWNTAMANTALQCKGYSFALGTLTNLNTNSKDEVKWYFVDDKSGTAPSYVKANEEGTPDRTINDFNIKTSDLSQDSANPTQLGYLMVRVEGSLQDHARDASGGFSVVVVGDNGTVA